MQTQPTKIMDERRFPVSLSTDIAPIRNLYDTAKVERWDPEKDIAWHELDRSGYYADALEAARLTWSRRAWIEYVGLCETPAFLVRLCLELDREADPKYFLTVRNTEEAWLIDCFHRYAKGLGGYIDQPPAAGTERIFNQYRHRQILDAEKNVDTLFATHFVAEDGLEVALFEAYIQNTKEPVAKSILEKSLLSKRRSVDFGWLYLTKLAADWSEEKRAEVGLGINSYFQETELQGYHCPWLNDRMSDEAIAAEITADAGLGAATQHEEEKTLRAYIKTLRGKLEKIGIPFAELEHPELGTL